ncbi:MAG TPA: hypothetical protein VFZ00_05000, partial [Solirubrobacter sp.]|nr:hypothetical protein [Solirubrobacter sp.]
MPRPFRTQLAASAAGGLALIAAVVTVGAVGAGMLAVPALKTVVSAATSGDVRLAAVPRADADATKSAPPALGGLPASAADHRAAGTRIVAAPAEPRRARSPREARRRAARPRASGEAPRTTVA